ncbi:MAG: hypothetical protein ACREBG_22395 [Pyrinomonadaceae bacterium]
MSDFSGDLASYRRDYGCVSAEFGCFQTCIADLTGSINLASVYLLIGTKLQAIMINARSGLGGSTLVTTDRLASPSIHAGNLVTSLSVDRNLRVVLVQDVKS